MSQRLVITEPFLKLGFKIYKGLKSTIKRNQNLHNGGTKFIQMAYQNFRKIGNEGFIFMTLVSVQHRLFDEQDRDFTKIDMQHNSCINLARFNAKQYNKGS